MAHIGLLDQRAFTDREKRKNRPETIRYHEKRNAGLVPSISKQHRNLRRWLTASIKKASSSRSSSSQGSLQTAVSSFNRTSNQAFPSLCISEHTRTYQTSLAAAPRRNESPTVKAALMIIQRNLSRMMIPGILDRRFYSTVTGFVTDDSHNRLKSNDIKYHNKSNMDSADQLEMILPLLADSRVQYLYQTRKNLLKPIDVQERVDAVSTGFRAELRWKFHPISEWTSYHFELLHQLLEPNNNNRSLCDEFSIKELVTKTADEVSIMVSGIERSKQGAIRSARRKLVKCLGLPTFSEIAEVYFQLIQQLKVSLCATTEERHYLSNDKETMIHCHFSDHWHSPINVKGIGLDHKESLAVARYHLWSHLCNIPGPVSTSSTSHETEKCRTNVDDVSSREDFKNLIPEDITKLLSTYHLVMSRLGIHEEIIESTTGKGGFLCTAVWTYVNEEGLKKISEGSGSGFDRKTAKAAARMNLMSQMGIEKSATNDERTIARQIQSLILNQKLEEAMKESLHFLQSSSVEGWCIVIPSLWKSILASYQIDYVKKLLLAFDDAANYSKNPRVVPVPLWEQMLFDCCLTKNSRFGTSVLAYLTGGASYDHKEKPSFIEGHEIQIDRSLFPSVEIARYYQHYRSMLTLELRAQINAQLESFQRDGDDMTMMRSLTMGVMSIARPYLRLKAQLTPESDGFLQKNYLVAGNYIVLRPSKFETAISWDKACIVRIHNISVLQSTIEINVCIVTDESLDDILGSPSFSIYPMEAFICHERMIAALSALCIPNWPLSKKYTKLHFSPALRLILLHSKTKEAKAVAQSGEVPEELLDAVTSHSPLKRNERKNDDLPETPAASFCRHPIMTQLTTQQQLAVECALKNRLTLIQGPPGTGKTFVASAIVFFWTRQNPTKKILVVADSNVAANNLEEGILKRGLKCARIGVGSNIDLQDFWKRSSSAADLINCHSEYSRLRQSKQERSIVFRRLIMNHQVLITTCIGSGHPMFDNCSFDRVLIDECAQSTEPAVLVPMSKGCSKLVLIGDIKQLPSTINSRESELRGLQISALERLTYAAVSKVILLNVQRRMHPSIAEFPNLHYYDGKLKNADVNDTTRPSMKGFRFPNSNLRVCFINTTKGLEMAEKKSKINVTEARIVQDIVVSILNYDDIDPKQIGILTPYSAQKKCIRRQLEHHSCIPSEIISQIEIGTVDGFQGREKDLIIFSAVRSNKYGEVGFLMDGRRMNVMLTRARRGLIVIGDARTLEKETLNWRVWLQWINTRHGSIDANQLKSYLQEDPLANAREQPQDKKQSQSIISAAAANNDDRFSDDHEDFYYDDHLISIN